MNESQLGHWHRSVVCGAGLRPDGGCRFYLPSEDVRPGHLLSGTVRPGDVCPGMRAGHVRSEVSPEAVRFPDVSPEDVRAGHVLPGAVL